MHKFIIGLLTIMIGIVSPTTPASAVEKQRDFVYDETVTSTHTSEENPLAFKLAYTEPVCTGEKNEYGGVPWESQIVITNLSNEEMAFSRDSFKGSVIEAGGTGGFFSRWDFPDSGPESFQFSFGSNPSEEHYVAIPAPACASREAPPALDEPGTIKSCDIAVLSTPTARPFKNTYLVGRPIDIVVHYNTDEPAVLTYFVATTSTSHTSSTRSLNEQSATDIQWVPDAAGDYVITAEFYDLDGNRLVIEDDTNCSANIEVTDDPGTDIVEPTPEPTAKPQPPKEPSPAPSSEVSSSEIVVRSASQASTVPLKELPMTGLSNETTRWLLLIGASACLIGCFCVMFSKKYR